MLKLSNLLKNKIEPFAFGSLISRIVPSQDNKYFAAISSFQESTKIENTSEEFNKDSELFLNKLNIFSESNKWISYKEYKEKYFFINFNFKGKEKAILIIENDLNIDKTSFFNKLYAKIYEDFSSDEILNEDKKQFIRGFFETRGSIDTQRKLLSIDLFYDSKFELNKISILSEIFCIPISMLNVNFRQLQNQFINNINKRNTQLRINLKWYAKNIGFLNDYKFKILIKVYNFNDYYKINDVNFINCELTDESKNLRTNVIIEYFKNLVLYKELNTYEIEKIRNELGFNFEELENKTTRNKKIVDFVLYLDDDMCYGCVDKFPIENRTFKHRKTGKYYFEIHHNISLSNNSKLDKAENLVKLCPVCHRCLKKNVGIEKEQKEIITNILKYKKEAKEFAQGFFDTKDEQELINNIYKNLK
ncbi:HNH endonuclease [Mycoplasma sp. AC157]